MIGSEGGEQSVTFDRVVKTYVKIREARNALKKEWETKDRKLAEDLATLEAHLLNSMNTVGVENFRTEHGTVYRTLDVIPQASDWEAFYAWVKKEDAFDFLERRIKKTAVKDYMEQHNGEVPPGVTTFSRYEVNVRKR